MARLRIPPIETLPPANGERQGEVWRIRGDGATPGAAWVCLGDGAGGFIWTPLDALSLNQQFTQRKTVGQDQASGTLVAIDDLVLPVGVNETWSVEWNLRVGTSGSGGISFGVWAPAGATSELEWLGSLDVTTTLHTLWSTTLNAATGPWWMFNVTNQNGHMTIRGIVATAATLGDVEVRFAPANGTDTITVHANSLLRAQRIGA